MIGNFYRMIFCSAYPYENLPLDPALAQSDFSPIYLLPRQWKQDQKQPLPPRLLLQEQLPPTALLPILSLFSSDESQISGLRRSIPAPEK